MSLKELITVLQVAVGPVILISGVGLLLLSMTNRLGRTIDRLRQLMESSRSNSAQWRRTGEEQLGILWRRARLLRAAIILSAISVLLAAVLIIVLFVGALWSLEVGVILAAIFMGCMTAVIASLAFFIYDVNLSLKALSLELKHSSGAVGTGERPQGK